MEAAFDSKITLLERFNTSQNNDFQRRVKIASLMLAGAALTSPLPKAPPDPASEEDLAGYEAERNRRNFAQRVAGDPDQYTPRIALALAAMADVTIETEDADLLKAMQRLFQVYVG